MSIDYMDIISSRLRAARIAKGLSQKELADVLGLDQGHLSRTENGKRGLTREQVRLAVKTLDISSDYLLGVDLNQFHGDDQPDADGEQQRLLASRSAPAGLRELASNLELVNTLRITEDEWIALSSIVLPHAANRDGYVQLLFTIRAIRQA